MSNKKKDPEYITLFGNKFAIIEELNSGWFLIAHPNGPALACDNDETGQWLCTIDRDHDVIPKDVQVTAREIYRELTWPLIKDKFFPSKAD